MNHWRAACGESSQAWFGGGPTEKGHSRGTSLAVYPTLRGPGRSNALGLPGELVGDFKNAGQAWGREPTAVNVHDYPHDAVGRAVPYGVYDVTNNRGLICLGTSGDTPAFAADAIAAWWQTEGQATYAADTDHLLLLADAGGSNGCRIRAWKERLQVQVCDRFGLTVTVCHYPTGCSKWNPASTDCSAR